MCFHKRLVFACNHHAWLNLTRPCALEQSFNRGEVDTGCDFKWSHGFDTISIQGSCSKCARVQASHKTRLSKAKEKIKALKAKLKTIQDVAETKDEEIPNQDSKQEEAGSQPDGTAVASEGAGSSFTSAGGGEDTEASSWEEGSLDETMEEVRVDPKHWPFHLAQRVAKRVAGEQV
ncbi:hypothetical protein C8A05DRAFT_14784 [Staphylotrichum tortipilum]|uniref:Uncharacterized protein n=1 Tax=Staphylotrichum tortipilum TaxID=2831512 RepID=A0AAN6RUI3_9PEZI|nr:hypothetical protein C8A05DRAFT_14784 [Staphylotrichum longicolle]